MASLSLSSWIRASLLTAGLIVLTAMPSAFVHADGMPLPWPFPWSWAKECATDSGFAWAAVQGRYLMENSVNQERLDLKLVLTGPHTYQATISRLSAAGRPLAQGLTTVTDGDLWLRANLQSLIRANEPASGVTLKMYHEIGHASCTTDELFPILTVDPTDAAHHATDYRLIKLKDGYR